MDTVDAAARFARAALKNTDDAARPVVEFDFEEYRDLVEGLDTNEAQAIELLKALWSIMLQFVELGYAVDICGHFEEMLEGDMKADSAALESV